jgi:hypothetical protein
MSLVVVVDMVIGNSKAESLIGYQTGLYLFNPTHMQPYASLYPKPFILSLSFACSLHSPFLNQ